MEAPDILVAGEALVDLKPVQLSEEPDDLAYQPHPGGSPYNVAVGLGRLNTHVGFLGCLSDDPFGERLAERLRANGVDPAHLHWDEAPSTLAFVHMPSAEAEPDYRFYGEGAADTRLTLEMLPASFGPTPSAIHLGSIAMVRSPIGETLTELMRREADRRVISFDPNVRPDLIPDRAAYRERLAQWLAYSTLVKVSRADLAWLEPDRAPDAIARDWLEAGPTLVVVTQGADGAFALTAGADADMDAPHTEVADTVGAGDAFTSGLLTWLHEQDALTPDALARLGNADLEDALGFATEVAARTTERAGAEPPHRTEIPL